MLDGTAITEFSEDGRKISAPTADRPAYVVIRSGGHYDFGLLPAGEVAPSAEVVDQRMETILARLHYQRTDTSHQPSLLIVFNWGVHRSPGDASGDLSFRSLLDRAALVGGHRFADDLRHVLEQNIAAVDATPTQQWGPRLEGMRGTSAASLFQSASPIEMFRRRDPKTEHLLEQITNDCFYVVISAYDHSSVVGGKRQLLWRTQLTTTARGASMATAIPALIESGAGYLGRDMKEPEFFSKHDR